MYRHYLSLVTCAIGILAAPTIDTRQVQSTSSEAQGNVLSSGNPSPTDSWFREGNQSTSPNPKRPQDDGSWYKGKYEGDATGYDDGQPKHEATGYNNDRTEVDGTARKCWYSFGPFAVNVCGNFDQFVTN